jgi:hypothetical protein
MMLRHGIGADVYHDDKALQIAVYRNDGGGLTIFLHTIWLPDFVEVVTEVHVTVETASMLLTVLMEALHGPHTVYSEMEVKP